MVGAAKGVIRSMLVDGDNLSEVVPVDICINGLITIAQQFATDPKPKQVPVFNITAADHRKVTWKYIMDLGKEIGLEYPFEAGLWYPDGNITTNTFVHMLNVFFFMWLPAYFIDFLLLIAGQKRFMVYVQTRISTGLEVLQFFTLRPWCFKSESFVKVWKALSAEDKKIFNQDSDSVETYEYLKTSLLGGRQYVMKEPLSSIPKARFQLKCLYILDRTCKIVFVGLLLRWLYGMISPMFMDITN